MTRVRAVDGAAALPVFPRRDIRAWPLHERGGQAVYYPLPKLFGSRFKTDAHFASYSVPSVTRRLARPALGRVEIPMVALVFDVDDDQAHQTGTASSREWFQRQEPKIHALLARHPGGFVYQTRAGIRLVYRLPLPFVLRDSTDEREWSRRYLGVACRLARRFDIVADPRCADWPRLYRVPHGTRDPAVGPEFRRVYGDPHEIGVWRSSAVARPRDHRTAERLARAHPAWRHASALLRPASAVGGRLAVSMPGAGASTPAYAAAALRSAQVSIVGAKSGARNSTLNDQAFAVARFIRLGQLDEVHLREGLLSAAVQAGLPRAEALATIESGVRGRLARP